MSYLARFTRSRRLAALAAGVALILVAGGVVLAAATPAIQTITPRRADQITNLDVLRQQIRNYYGDPLGTGVFAPDSNYAQEAQSVAADGARWLATGWRGHGPGGRGAHAPAGKKAIVLDVDDTTLATWNYEVYSNWAYNYVSPPGKTLTNGDFVNQQLFPPVPGMVDMVKQAAAEGYAVFWITGRPDGQHAATLGNLGTDGTGVDAGYPAPTAIDIGHGGFTDGLFTKPPLGSYPAYLNEPQFCAASIAANVSCPTIQYKSGTRAYIESMGYDIVGDFGDQYSDLTGGYADRTFKMPNPNYFLP